MKKTYMTPQVKVVILKRRIHLLAGSIIEPKGRRVYDDYYEESDGDIL